MNRLALIAALALAATSAAAAAPTPASAVYSSMCVGRETGDIGGRRMAVIRFNGEVLVVFQAGEGAPLEPHLVKATLDDKTGALSFRLPAPENQTIRGVLTETAFTYSEYGIKNVLKRLTAWEKSLPNC